MHTNNITMKKPVALYFAPYLAPWGVDIYVELAKYFEINLVLFYENAKEQNFNQVILRDKIKDINIIILDKGIDIGDRYLRFGLLKLLTKYKPNVIFSHEYSPLTLTIGFYRLIKLFKFKHICMTSDNEIMAQNVILARKVARFFSLKTADGLMVYTPDIKAWYSTRFPKLDVRICPNIQNPIVLKKDLNKIINFANIYTSKYNLENTSILLYVGRLHKIKGLRELMIAFSISKLPSQVLVIVGDGDMRQSLLKLSFELGIQDFVFLPGRFDAEELYAWYYIAHGFILPSLYEPLGAVVNEALNFGLPVLCSKFAGAKFYIKESYNGSLFDPSNKDDFINSLNNFNREYMNLKKDNSLKNNLNIYSFEDFVKNYYDIFAT